MKALQNKRIEVVKAMRDMNDKAKAESRGFTDEESTKWDEMVDAVSKIDDQIKRHNELERLGDIPAILDVAPKAARNDPDVKEAEKRDTYSDAFGEYIRRGLNALSPERRAMIEQRAQSVGTNTAGGYTVAEDFHKEIEKAMLAFGGMREVARVIPTSTGGDMPWVTTNDTSNTGALISENAADTTKDVVFGQVLFSSYTYTSKLVLVSLEMMQDSEFDVSGLLSGILAERLARITNTHFTTGTGTAQPNGVVTASTLGKTGANGQTTSIIYDDLVDLEHSVDPNYRKNSTWMANDSSIKVLKKLKDGNSLPLWVPELAGGAPQTILGYRYTINNDVAAMAANAKSLLFGDFKKYVIRDVRGISLMRLAERYAEYRQVGFFAFSRHDGDLIDAGTHPIKYYANSAV